MLLHNKLPNWRRKFKGGCYPLHPPLVIFFLSITSIWPQKMVVFSLRTVQRKSHHRLTVCSCSCSCSWVVSKATTCMYCGRLLWRRVSMVTRVVDGSYDDAYPWLLVLWTVAMTTRLRGYSCCGRLLWRPVSMVTRPWRVCSTDSGLVVGRTARSHLCGTTVTGDDHGVIISRQVGEAPIKIILKK